MNRVIVELPSLSSVLLPVVAAANRRGVEPGWVLACVNAINRKCLFASHHMRILNGIDWSRAGSIGRLGGAGETERMIIQLQESSLHLTHPGAVVDQVYMALDGLTAASVNAIDSLARLVNQAYGMGIRERQASILAVRDRSRAGSPLGIVLHDATLMGWLKGVRDLRGECQHADVEGVLIRPAGRFASGGEPQIPADYAWGSPPVATPVVKYATDVLAAAEATLIACIRAVIAAPTDPVR